MFKSIKKLFHLPTPKELGRSDHNALPFSFLSKPGDYCWEDWRKEVKEKYPITYFLVEELPKSWSYIKYPFVFIYDYIKYNYFKTYHFLDLRQPKTVCECDNYRYGYSDVRQRFLYAGFNLLVEFVEKDLKSIEGLHFVQECYNSDEFNKENAKYWVDFYKEVEILYNYWKYDRKKDYVEANRLFWVCEKSKLEEDRQKWHDAEDKLDKDEQEMFVRLAKIREGMWI